VFFRGGRAGRGGGRPFGGVRNAGGNWVGRAVVEDGNRVTSRQPDDLPAFNRAVIRLFSRSPSASRR
jgi:protease I